MKIIIVINCECVGVRMSVEDDKFQKRGWYLNNFNWQIFCLGLSIITIIWVTLHLHLIM